MVNPLAPRLADKRSRRADRITVIEDRQQPRAPWTNSRSSDLAHVPCRRARGRETQHRPPSIAYHEPSNLNRVTARPGAVSKPPNRTQPLQYDRTNRRLYIC